MLRAVGNPVVVNPDPPLAEIAREEGWQTMRFERLGRRLGRRRGHPAGDRRRLRRLARRRPPQAAPAACRVRRASRWATCVLMALAPGRSRLADGGRAGVQARVRAARRRVLDHLRPADRAALHGRRIAPADPEETSRQPRRVPVHPRALPVDVPGAALDDAPVRRLRHRRGDQRALPLPARPRPDRALDRLRHADPDGLRLRPRAQPRRGRPRGRRRRHARRHGAALRRASRSAASPPR